MTRSSPLILPERTIYQALIIFLACFYCYSASFRGGWLWDDDSEITAHDALTRVSGIVEIWAAKSSVDYLPVKSSFQWVMYRFLGPDPYAWRVLNAFLHFLSCLLIWRVFARLRIPYAWLGGLIFAVHPLTVCTVAWISELKNTLSLPFLLMAFLRYLDFTEKGQAKDLRVAALWFLAATFTKASGVMFPFVLLLYQWWRSFDLAPKPEAESWRGVLRSVRWREIFSTAPFFAISLLGGLSTIYFQQARAIGGEELPLGGAFFRVMLAGTNTWFYLYKSFLPFRLIPNYPQWQIDPPSLLQLLAWPALIVVMLICWRYRRTWGRHVLFGLATFLVCLFPVMGFISMSYMRITWASDHLAYLPLVAIVGLITAGIGLLWDHGKETSAKPLLVFGFVSLAIFVIQTQNYALVYRDEDSMWSYTLKRNPDAWQAHSRFSRVLLDKGDQGGAMYHVQESNRLRPDLPETHNNYAAAFVRQGDLEKARKSLEKAVEMAPNADMYKMNLANLYLRINERQAANELLADLVKRRPNNPVILTNYGASLYYDGKKAEAIELFKRALAINPNLDSARSNLAAAMSELGSAVGLLPGQSASKPSGSVGLLDSSSPLLFFPR